MIRTVKALYTWLIWVFFLLVLASLLFPISWWLVFFPLILAIVTPSPRADRQPPRTIRPPVIGRWITGNSPANKVPSHGVRTLGQAFAIDILQSPNSPERTSPGWALRQAPPEDYACFGQPVLASSSGTVVAKLDKMHDHRARNTWPGLIFMMSIEAFVRGLASPRFTLGNHVIIDHGDGAFSLYAHLKHGSVSITTGQQVQAGDFLGQVGNTGNSSEPHLHFQLMDRANPTMAAGLPFRWAHITTDPEPDPYWTPKKPALEQVAGLPATGQVFHCPG
ncbi:M23 family metallopeptidase [Corynebacterium sp. H128]|uniref:M23 family metallopeptidase n=1 Tax=Corynebacterium sp. H128 TaxID=3133427 RepID=UPI00309A20E7